MSRTVKVALAVLSALLLASCSSRVEDSGPVTPSGTISLLGIPVVPGQQIASGDNIVENSGEENITLESASLHSKDLASEAPRITRIWVMDATASSFTAGEFNTLDGPPRELLKPLRGYQLPPHGVVQVVFLLDVSHEGRWLWDGIDLNYSYQGAEYRVFLTNGVKICSSKIQSEREPCNL